MSEHCFGHLHGLVGEHIDELKGVGDGLPLEVVVGDDERGISLRREVADSLRPGFELLSAVKVVVALLGMLLAAEPVLVVAAVQPHVTYWRRGSCAGLDGTSDDRLIDIAEAHAQIGEQLESLGIVP